MSRTDLVEMVKTIHPKKVIPIHTTNADEFNKMGFDALGVEVILPEKGKIYPF